MARGLDQHNHDVAIGSVIWSANGGTIDNNGVFVPVRMKASLV